MGKWRFYGGIFAGRTWENGNFINGQWCSGVFSGGQWCPNGESQGTNGGRVGRRVCSWHNGRFEGDTWHAGYWVNGVWDAENTDWKSGRCWNASTRSVKDPSRAPAVDSDCSNTYAGGGNAYSTFEVCIDPT